MTHEQMRDEYEIAIAYDRMIKGNPDEVEYDSEDSEDDVLSQLDMIGPPPPSTMPDHPNQATEAFDERPWDSLEPEEQQALLERLDSL